MSKQNSDQAVRESGATLAELSTRVDELIQHTELMRKELAALSFMTIVSAADQEGRKESYERLGERNGVRQAVVMLYERVMADPKLAPYFLGADMLRIRRRQADMFLALFGIEDYAGENLGVVHNHVHIDQPAFDRLMDHIAVVLSHFGMTEEESVAFIAKLREFQTQIVSSPG